MGDCNRCGKCCFIPVGDDGEMKACPNLVQPAKGVFHCRIFKDRLGRKIGEYHGEEFFCRMYNERPTEIDGCPVNVGGKPVVMVMLNWQNKTAIQKEVGVQ